jgi:hypothetical protein
VDDMNMGTDMGTGMDMGTGTGTGTDMDMDMDMGTDMSSIPDGIIMNGSIPTSSKISDIQFQYMDYPGQERGQGTLMMEYKSGLDTLMHLTPGSESSNPDGFTIEELVWAPNTTNIA